MSGCISALGSGAIGDELARFFTPDAVQIEFPNRLNADGGRSDLATILLRAEQGQKLLTQQTYEIQSETAEDSQVAIEAIWTGTIAVPVGTLAPGSTIRAHFAIHFEMRDGRIALQLPGRLCRTGCQYTSETPKSIPRKHQTKSQVSCKRGLGVMGSRSKYKMLD